MDKIVYITWVDSCHTSDWKSRDNAKQDEISLCETIGFLLKKNKTEISVFQSKSDIGNVTDIMVIPRKAIKRIQYLQFRES